MVTLIFTLGWDERFQIRSIIRHSVKEKAKVIVIIGEPIDERSNAARERLRKFVREYLYNSTYEEVIVNPQDFPSSIAKIAKKIKEAEEPIIANLSGGMRALIMATLLAIVASKKKVTIEIELENQLGVVSFFSSLINLIQLDTDEINILRKAVECGEVTIQMIMEKLGLPKATAYKKLERLTSLGLFKKRFEDRQAVYSITRSGVIALAMCEGY